MAREATITQEQVYAIADAMKLEGKRPTSRGVRERLGTGSMGTINKMLQRWKAEHEQHVLRPLTLPPALERVVLDFMEQERTAARAELETQVADLQLENADLAAENERQDDQIASLNADLSTLAEDRAAAEGRAEQLDTDLKAAVAEAAAERQAAEHARTELAKALLRLEAMPRLEEDLERARAEIDHERTGRVAAEREAAVLLSQKADLQSRLGAAAASLEAHDGELEAQSAASQTEIARVREEAAKALQEHRTDAADRLAQAREETARIMDELRRAREEASATLQAQRSDAAERLAQAREETARAIEQIANLNKALQVRGAAKE